LYDQFSLQLLSLTFYYELTADMTCFSCLFFLFLYGEFDVCIGIDNLHITSLEMTSQKSAFILIRIFVFKSVMPLESRCSDITVCTQMIGEA
jgi:hypothetical protein